MDKVAARYVGEHEVQLFKHGGPYYDADGKRLEEMTLRKGDTLMINPQELHGMTWLIDPRLEKDPLQLGVGRVVLPEDQGKSAEELSAIGYQFHKGRQDFEPVVVQSILQEKKKKEAQ